MHIIMQLTCLMHFAFGYYGKFWFLVFVSIGERKSHGQSGIWHLCVMRRPIGTAEEASRHCMINIILIEATVLGNYRGAVSYLFSNKDRAWKEEHGRNGFNTTMPSNSLVGHTPNRFGMINDALRYQGEVSLYDPGCE